MKTLQPTPYGENPDALGVDIPEAEPYPIDALGPLKNAVLAACDQTEVDHALAAQSALSVASLVVQAHANIELLANGVAPLSLFCVTLAESGERKTASDKKLMRGIVEFERRLSIEAKDDNQSYKIDLSIWKSENTTLLSELNAAKKKKDKTKQAAAMADLKKLVEPKPPLTPRLTFKDVTWQGIQKLYQESPPSLGLYTDEGVQFTGGHAMQSENLPLTLGGMSDIWGGAPIDRVRAGDGNVRLWGRRLAMHLMIQPFAARKLLADPMANGQGFLARCLICYPPSTQGTRERHKSEWSSESEPALQAFEAIVLERLERAPATEEHDPQELKPKLLRLSVDAEKVLWEYYLKTERQLLPGGKFENLKAFVSKTAEQAARISGVLTLFENIDAVEVDAETMSKAITLAEYYLNEALRLVGTAEISQEAENAQKLIIWMHHGWKRLCKKSGRDHTTVLYSDIQQLGPRSLKQRQNCKAACDLLLETRHLKILPKDELVDGKKRALAFRIMPDGDLDQVPPD